MPSVVLEVILIILLILLNGYFSMSEIALLSVKKSRLRSLSKQGNKKAQNALFLTRKSPEMLSTIQISITVLGIFAGAYGGVTIAKHLANYLNQFVHLAKYSETISFSVVVIAIIYLSLVIGELVPKQMALASSEKISLKVAGPIKLIMKIFSPLIKILSGSTLAVLKILRLKPATEQVVTEEEINLLIAEGTESGVFERAEQKMVERIFYLGNKPIKHFMTPETEVVWLDINDSPAVIRNKIAGSDKSVFPVCQGSLDNNLGAIESKDILTHLFNKEQEGINLKSLIQPVMRIDAEVPSLVAIERLKKSAISIVLITQKETHEILGIISFHDILEAIVGEFEEA